MNILLFGGSFDPVHNGHIRLLETMLACDRLAIDRTIVMPAYVSPFKQGNTGGASPEDRLEMCRIAFKDITGAEISGHEISAGTVSYTADTVDHLRDKYPDDRLFLAVGGDSLKTLPTWHRFRDIMSACTVAAAARCDAERNEIAVIAEELSGYGRVEAVDSEPFEISSTRIREMIRSGEDISGYVPAEEAVYIYSRRLYL